MPVVLNDTIDMKYPLKPISIRCNRLKHGNRFRLDKFKRFHVTLNPYLWLTLTVNDCKPVKDFDV